MKRFWLLLFAITIKMAVVAQTTTLPMVVEGRTWNVVSINPAYPSEATNGYYDILGRKGRVFDQSTYVLEGDTIMGGVTYKRLLSGGKCILGMREEDGRIYERGQDWNSEVLLYDFNAQPGDVFEDPDDGSGSSWMQVEQVGQVDVGGQSRRCLIMYSYYMDPLLGTIKGGYFADYWIEGIGCTGGPYFTSWYMMIGNKPLLLSCYDGDECIFDIEEFAGFVTTSVEDIPRAVHSRSVSPDAPIYDLQGRRLSATPQKGVYIQHGKKRVVK
jgi:hypothetical protein